MDSLRAWMNEQFQQRKVEPNFGLGQALTYMLKRWEPLIRFLEVPGAPLADSGQELAPFSDAQRVLNPFDAPPPFP